jgi:hypothetical protein
MFLDEGITTDKTPVYVPARGGGLSRTNGGLPSFLKSCCDWNRRLSSHNLAFPADHFSVAV